MNAAASELKAKGQSLDKKKKASRRRYFIGIPLVLVLALVVFGLMPVQGTIKYGICKVFIEQRTTYPGELKFVSLAERPNDAKIEYTYINEFGDTQFNTITCTYGPDQGGIPVLTGIVINRRKVNQSEIHKFNQTIPAILAYPPSLNAPLGMGDDLMSLWRG